MSKLSFRARALDVGKSMPVVLYVLYLPLASTSTDVFVVIRQDAFGSDLCAAAVQHQSGAAA